MSHAPRFATAAALFALAACSEPAPEPTNASVDPAANAIANVAPVVLPPAIRAERSFRCADNSLAFVTFFQGDQQVNFRFARGEKPVILRAPQAGEPYVADGGWTLTGNEAGITVESPGKPSQACRL